LKARLRIIVSLSALLATASVAGAAEAPSVRSPDGRLELCCELIDGAPYYSVRRDGAPVVLPSPLGLRFRHQAPLGGGFFIANQESREQDSTWSPVWGQQASIRDHYRELAIELRETAPPGRSLGLVFRAYDDGVAFRYVLPEQRDLGHFVIISELTQFRFTGNHRSWSIPADYDSYEHLYRELPLDELDAVDTPLTLETRDGLTLSIHEAALTDWAGMTLARRRDLPYTLESDLVPWPDGDKVRGQTPMSSPWRTLQIAETPGGLVESNLILNLNEPCRLEDTSWIRPMKYLGIWWGMHIGKYSWHAGPKHGATNENTRRTLDFAAEQGFDAVLVEGWNLGWESWGAKDAFDFVTPYPDFDLPALVRYGAERDVALIGHHETGGDVPRYEAQLDSAFALYARLGVPAVKTGYAGGIWPRGMHHHGQWMVRHYRKVVEKAAEYRLMIDAHEPIKDTGISRSWPNMMTREGARGMEYNAWSEGNPPEHETILLFTRMLAGPMDFTPGIFDLEFNAYKPDNRVRSTLARQLALGVVLFSPLQMAADLPENYALRPDAFAFLRDLPVVWDETRVPAARIGDFACVARRSGDDWYLGCITDELEREISLPLDFLAADARFDARIYADGPWADWETRPYDLSIEERRGLGPEDRLDLRLAPGGGAAIQLKALR